MLFLREIMQRSEREQRRKHTAQSALFTPQRTWPPLPLCPLLLFSSCLITPFILFCLFFSQSLFFTFLIFSFLLTSSTFLSFPFCLIFSSLHSFFFPSFLIISLFVSCLSSFCFFFFLLLCPLLISCLGFFPFLPVSSLLFLVRLFSSLSSSLLF